jgi:hypothetical protein
MYFVELEVVLVVVHPVIFVIVLFYFCVRVEAEAGVVAFLIGKLVKPPLLFFLFFWTCCDWQIRRRAILKKYN